MKIVPIALAIMSLPLTAFATSTEPREKISYEALREEAIKTKNWTDLGRRLIFEMLPLTNEELSKPGYFEENKAATFITTVLEYTAKSRDYGVLDYILDRGVNLTPLQWAQVSAQAVSDGEQRFFELVEKLYGSKALPYERTYMLFAVSASQAKQWALFHYFLKKAKKAGESMLMSLWLTFGPSTKALDIYRTYFPLSSSEISDLLLSVVSFSPQAEHRDLKLEQIPLPRRKLYASHLRFVQFLLQYEGVVIDDNLMSLARTKWMRDYLEEMRRGSTFTAATTEGMSSESAGSAGSAGPAAGSASLESISAFLVGAARAGIVAAGVSNKFYGPEAKR